MAQSSMPTTIGAVAGNAQPARRSSRSTVWRATCTPGVPGGRRTAEGVAEQAHHLTEPQRAPLAGGGQRPQPLGERALATAAVDALELPYLDGKRDGNAKGGTSLDPPLPRPARKAVRCQSRPFHCALSNVSVTSPNSRGAALKRYGVPREGWNGSTPLCIFNRLASTTELASSHGKGVELYPPLISSAGAYTHTTLLSSLELR
jgi:hypothetical protein